MDNLTLNPALFPPTREAALEALAQFVERAGAPYARGRNTDPGPGLASAVSRLSPYVRYRLVTEAEIVAAVLSRHTMSAADKFIQEVLWRTYWKGWLEMRPLVWTRFEAERDHQSANFADRLALSEAEDGRTGISGFDDWVKELKATGYLHNHARMWFASIWIFTLRLPWTLGADFFLRHLIDADAASNTLSWRWVAGLQTPGKTYLATRDNIARYTNGRFVPSGLAQVAHPLSEPPIEPPGPLPTMVRFDAAEPTLLLVTSEDMSPESAIDYAQVRGVVVSTDQTDLWGDAARGFVRAAAQDSAQRTKAHYQSPSEVTDGLGASALIDAAARHGVRQIVTPYAPTGPVAAALRRLEPELARAGVSLVQVRRDWDSQFWPYAKKGFFTFKDAIPALLGRDGLLPDVRQL